MKYSNIVITDENMDEEFEKLEGLKAGEYSVFGYSEFTDQLSDGFKCQIDEDGKEKWVNYQICNGCIEGQNAYEFANGFLVIDVAAPL